MRWMLRAEKTICLFRSLRLHWKRNRIADTFELSLASIGGADSRAQRRGAGDFGQGQHQSESSEAGHFAESSPETPCGNRGPFLSVVADSSQSNGAEAAFLHGNARRAHPRGIRECRSSSHTCATCQKAAGLCA